MKATQVECGVDTATGSAGHQLTFPVQPFLLVEYDELAVLVGLLQDVLALLDVTVVVLQTQQGRHQGHVGL